MRTASGATAAQIAESVEGQRWIVAHVGSARTEAELGVLLERARALLTDDAQGELDLGVEPSPGKVDLVAAPDTEQPLFGVPGQPAGRATRVAPARVVATCSRLLFDTLAGVYDDLGFGVVGDEVFRDLVIARIVEPTSILDTGRVLADLGQVPASEKTMRRTLARCVGRGYRDQVAALCFAHATTTGDLSLVLYDATTLYFQAEAEDALRKVGYSKERRVDPQIVVGLLVDRTGAPLEIGCYAGNKAETQTIIPIVEQFARRHQLADMAVVADAGMLSASNLRELDDAHLRFIVGSRLTKAPIDLASHFRWHGDAFTDGQVIDTLTPKSGRVIENDPLHKAEPVWDPALPGRHPRTGTVGRCACCPSNQASPLEQGLPEPRVVPNNRLMEEWALIATAGAMVPAIWRMVSQWVKGRRLESGRAIEVKIDDSVYLLDSAEPEQLEALLKDLKARARSAEGST